MPRILILLIFVLSLFSVALQLYFLTGINNTCDEIKVNYEALRVLYTDINDRCIKMELLLDQTIQTTNKKITKEQQYVIHKRNVLEKSFKYNLIAETLQQFQWESPLPKKILYTRSGVCEFIY